MYTFLKRGCLASTLILLSILLGGCSVKRAGLPNILWITSEDNGRFLGCYGDSFATTPNLDRLADEGFLYTNAYANAPVCAPARNTIITGVHACANGNEQMRSNYRKSDRVRYYTEFLQERGYYCTNNSKTDYNTRPVDLEAMWDECSGKAHYKNRAEGQPFFAIFNITISHESSIHTPVPDSALRHRPAEVTLPPFHPDTPEIRHDWAQYYDRVEDMDTRVGQLLEELDSLGLSENTIVFYYSDHGGVLGRSKRYLYETGTHVPMIVRIPERFKKLYPARKPGTEVDRLVSFVDLAPTLLSLTWQEAPGYMQGHAFLGMHKTEAPAYIYMFRDRMDERYDMSRSIVDGRYRYTRNYNPSRIYMQHLDYLWRAPSMRSWEETCKSGACNEVQARWWQSKPVEELYDTESDPWEVHNLAGDPAHRKLLAEMRQASFELAFRLADAGFIPEADRNIRSGDMAIYDYIRSPEVPLEEIMDAARLASDAARHSYDAARLDPDAARLTSDAARLSYDAARLDPDSDPSNPEKLASLLKHDDSAVRYWAATGLLLLGEQARPYRERLLQFSFDESWNVSVVCAETLYLLGETEAAVKAYKRVLGCPEPMARTHALNSIDHVDADSGEFLGSCLKILEGYGELDRSRQYDVRAIKWLFEKWNIEPGDVGIEFPW